MADCAPGCPPGLRPDLPRSDRSFGFFLYGLSEEGGFDDVEESFASRRSSSSTRAASAWICASRAASCAAARSSRSAAACRSRALSASSSATRAGSHPAGSEGGACGVPGTRRSPSGSAIRDQRNTPSRLTKIRNQALHADTASPEPLITHPQPHRLNSYLRTGRHRAFTHSGRQVTSISVRGPACGQVWRDVAPAAAGGTVGGAGGDADEVTADHAAVGHLRRSPIAMTTECSVWIFSSRPWL